MKTRRCAPRCRRACLAISVLIAGRLKEIGFDIKLSVVDEGVPGDDIWDNMRCLDPNDSAARFTIDQIGNHSEMDWSNAEYDKLTAGSTSRWTPPGGRTCSSSDRP